MLDVLLNLLYSAYAGFMSGGGADAANLKIDAGMLGIVDWLWDYLAIAAMGMTIIYFLFEVNQKIAFEGHDVTMKTWILCFGKLALAVAIYSNVPKICSAAIGTYNYVIEQADKAKVGVDGEVATPTDGFTLLDKETVKKGEVDETTMKQMKAKLSGMGLLELMGFFPMVLIMCLLNWILSFIWMYKAFVYRFEVLWKIGVTPIAFADVYTGSNSQAIRWVKSLLGTAVYGAAFFLIVKIGGSIMSSEMGTSFQTWFGVGAAESVGEAAKNTVSGFIQTFRTCLEFIVIPFAELGALGAIRQVTKEAFG